MEKKKKEAKAGLAKIRPRYSDVDSELDEEEEVELLGRLSYRQAWEALSDERRLQINQAVRSTAMMYYSEEEKRTIVASWILQAYAAQEKKLAAEGTPAQLLRASATAASHLAGAAQAAAGGAAILYASLQDLAAHPEGPGFASEVVTAVLEWGRGGPATTSAAPSAPRGQ